MNTLQRKSAKNVFGMNTLIECHPVISFQQTISWSLGRTRWAHEPNSNEIRPSFLESFWDLALILLVPPLLVYDYGMPQFLFHAEFISMHANLLPARQKFFFFQRKISQRPSRNEAVPLFVSIDRIWNIIKHLMGLYHVHWLVSSFLNSIVRPSAFLCAPRSFPAWLWRRPCWAGVASDEHYKPPPELADSCLGVARLM